MEFKTIFMNLLNIVKENLLISIILFACFVLLCYFNSKKNKLKNVNKLNKLDDEERQKLVNEDRIEKEKKSKSYKKNYVRKEYSSYEQHGYDFAPKDGGTLMHKGSTGRKYKQKHKNAHSLERLNDYKHYLDKLHETNLNTVAKNLRIINKQCADDIKFLQKKGYFKNIDIDEINCRIIYHDVSFNPDFMKSEEYWDVEEETNDNIEIIEDENEEILPGTNITHICPHCGTPNIIDGAQKEYNCYYCLNKVLVKGKNKK